MKEVRATAAKSNLLQLLDDVERGETVVITRHGRPIARIVPECERRKSEIEKVIDGIRLLQKRNGKIAVDDLLSAKCENCKY